MGRSGIQKFIVCIALFLVLIYIVQLVIYKPVKAGIWKNQVDRERNYIFCEYVEVTGFFWRVIYSNKGEECKYVKLTGINPEEICSNQILYGDNVFVFYGKYVDNSYDSLLEGEDYITFMVEDWNVLKPIKRLGKFFEPFGYMYEKDFVK